MHLDILYRGLIELQRRPTLPVCRLVKHFVLSENTCYEHLQLLVGKIDPEALPPSFREREVASEQFWVVQVSFRVELVSVFVPVRMAIEEGGSHANDRASGDDNLLAIRRAEDKIVVWSYAVLAMSRARVQTECFFYESVQEWQSAELRRIGGLVCVRHHGLEFCSKSMEDRDIVENVERQS
jgi:hypothetical protein